MQAGIERDGGESEQPREDLLPKWYFGLEDWTGEIHNPGTYSSSFCHAMLHFFL
jgi:hypothetical protein